VWCPPEDGRKQNIKPGRGLPVNGVLTALRSHAARFFGGIRLNSDRGIAGVADDQRGQEVGQELLCRHRADGAVGAGLGPAGFIPAVALGPTAPGGNVDGALGVAHGVVEIAMKRRFQGCRGRETS